MPFLPLFLLNLSTGSASAVGQPFLKAYECFTAELGVRFPISTNTVLTPTELSGALLTLSSASLASSYLSLWYEKVSASSMTGNIYVTSSAGKLQLASVPIFDDNFYNLTVVKNSQTGSLTLYTTRYDSDELVFSTSSFVLSGTTGYPLDSDYCLAELGSSVSNPSKGQFWAQEFRIWSSSLVYSEILDHADNFESYGREKSINNRDLKVHWRLNDGTSTDNLGKFYTLDSTLNSFIGSGSGFVQSTNPFVKFLENYSYIPSIDYGWNQEKVRVYDGSSIEDQDAYHDEKFVSLEFNMYDALNEDISHIMSSYEEMNDFLGLPINKYREEYEGLNQMRETYFKRLQGQLNFRVFVDMLDFFDSTFISVVEKILPARALFKGDELVVESHMLERPKYQYQLRPVHHGKRLYRNL